MNEPTARFAQVEVGDMIEVEFTNRYTPIGTPATREGIVNKIKYDEGLESNVIRFDSYVVAEYRKSELSATNVITKIIKPQINPEYFL